MFLWPCPILCWIHKRRLNSRKPRHSPSSSQWIFDNTQRLWKNYFATCNYFPNAIRWWGLSVPVRLLCLKILLTNPELRALKKRHFHTWSPNFPKWPQHWGKYRSRAWLHSRPGKENRDRKSVVEGKRVDLGG